MKQRNLQFPLLREEYVKLKGQRFFRVALTKFFNIMARFMLIPQLRNFLYRLMGIKLGKKVFIGLDSYLDDQFPELITIGEGTTISYRVIIVAHDDSGQGYVNPVTIGKRVYIGVGAIVLPGVRIGDDSIVGAGSVVTKDVPQGVTVAGCPANVISKKND